MKIYEISMRIMKIIKNHRNQYEKHETIMKILEIHLRLYKIMEVFKL